MNRRLFAAAVALTTICCAATSNAFAATIADDVAPVVGEFRESYFGDLRADRVVGLSLAVVSSDEILWADSYGWADRATRTEATVNTAYLIGSVTKVFTALAVMQLVDRGLVDLDESYTAYVPEFSMRTRFGDIDDITVRHLLTHHAGIPDDVWAGKFRAAPEDYRTLVAAASDMDACYPPGTIRVYSNLGYSLLGYLVERVGGQCYQDYIRTKILAPLGMTQSGFFTRADQRDGLATGYTGRRPTDELPLRDVPAGSIASTVADMARLVQALLRDEGAIVSPEALAEIFRLQNLAVELDLDDRVGLCFTISAKAPDLGRTFEHGGATLAHRARIWIAPDADLGAVILSNSATGADSAWRVHEELMIRLAQERGVDAAGPAIPEKPVHFVARAATDPATLTGTYAHGDLRRARDRVRDLAAPRRAAHLDRRSPLLPCTRRSRRIRSGRSNFRTAAPVASHVVSVPRGRRSHALRRGETVGRPGDHRRTLRAVSRASRLARVRRSVSPERRCRRASDDRRPRPGDARPRTGAEVHDPG